MSTQFAENALLYNDFLDYLTTADDVRIVGPSQVTSPGLRVWLLIGDVWRAFRITDQFSATQLTSTGLSAAAVSNQFPGSLTQALAVRLPTSQTVGFATGGVLAGRTSCANGAATQLTAGATTANNFLVKNLDAVNAVELGANAFTPGTGFPLETLGTSDDSVWLRNANPSFVYGAGIGAAVTVAWLIA